MKYAKRHRLSSADHAFTLIEMLCSVAVIAVLLAILLPAISAAKSYARKLGSLARESDLLQMVTMYSADYRDSNLYFTDPAGPTTTLKDGRFSIEVVYFEAEDYWNFAMKSGGYVSTIFDERFFAPGKDVGFFPDYRYAGCFIARPEFWNRSTRTGPDQWRPTQLSQVRYPSGKGMLTRFIYHDVNDTTIDGNMFDVGFVDGHAARVERDECSPPYDRGEGDWVGSFHHSGWVIHHTVDGVFGRDQ